MESRAPPELTTEMWLEVLAWVEHGECEQGHSQVWKDVEDLLSLTRVSKRLEQYARAILHSHEWKYIAEKAAMAGAHVAWVYATKCLCEQDPPPNESWWEGNPWVWSEAQILQKILQQYGGDLSWERELLAMASCFTTKVHKQQRTLVLETAVMKRYMRLKRIEHAVCFQRATGRLYQKWFTATVVKHHYAQSIEATHYALRMATKSRVHWRMAESELGPQEMVVEWCWQSRQALTQTQMAKPLRKLGITQVQGWTNTEELHRLTSCGDNEAKTIGREPHRKPSQNLNPWQGPYNQELFGKS